MLLQSPLGLRLRESVNMVRIAVGKNTREFNPNTFLATIGEGRKIVQLPKKQTIFTQGDKADSVFYVQKGKVRLTVVSKTGKEATIGIVGAPPGTHVFRSVCGLSAGAEHPL